MKFLSMLLLVMTLVVMWPQVSQARRAHDGLIVFSAQRYERRMIPKIGHRLREVSGRHLWLVRADGTGLRRLTWGADVEDEAPSWSPDGKWVLFVRRREGRGSVCLIRASDGRVRTLYEGHVFIDPPKWSPDGRLVAVPVSVDLGETRDESVVVLGVSPDRVARLWKIAGGATVAWSPDSRRLYLGYDDGRDRIFDVGSGKAIAVKSPVWGAVWLDDDTVFGTVPEQPEHLVDSVRAIDGRGLVKWTRLLTPSLKMLNEFPDRYDQDWYRAPGDPRHLFLEYHTRFANGGHYDTFRVSLPSMRTVSKFDECRWVGNSRDGAYVVGAVSYWIEEDGQDVIEEPRVGPIIVKSMRSGKVRAVTPELWAVSSGDCQW